MTDLISARIEALAQFVEQLDIPIPSRLAPSNEARWREIDLQFGNAIAGRRGLVLGGDVLGDARALAARGAGYVLGCVTADEQAREQEPRSLPVLDLRPLRWRELDPTSHGSFDVVLCNDLVHRVTEPLALLRTLRSVTADSGTLLISSIMLDDPERSEYLRFVPDSFSGDSSCWFIPGRLAFRWLLQTAGFEVGAEFAVSEGPRELFPVVWGYLSATAS